VGIRVIAAGRSDVGLQREHNEDSFVLLDRHGLFVVADGMGGHKAGDVASKMATEAVSAFFDSTVRDDATWPFHYDPSLSSEENRLITGIKVANKSIYEESARNVDHRGMGTTLVGMLVSKQGRAFVGHVGDSRCYRIRGGKIELLTQDHSLLNEYLRAMPHMSEALRDDLPRNVITRALGMSEGVTVDVASDEVLPYDRYVLCSDGLSGMISDEEILKIVSSYDDPDKACEALIAAANGRGGEDNITAVVVHILPDARSQPPPAEP
jgi:protein phosphatase